MYNKKEFAKLSYFNTKQHMPSTCTIEHKLPSTIAPTTLFKCNKDKQDYHAIFHRKDYIHQPYQWTITYYLLNVFNYPFL